MNDFQKKQQAILDQINALEPETAILKAVAPLGPNNQGKGSTMEEFGKAVNARKKIEELEKELFELHKNK